MRLRYCWYSPVGEPLLVVDLAFIAWLVCPLHTWRTVKRLDRAVLARFGGDQEALVVALGEIVRDPAWNVGDVIVGERRY